MQKMYFQKSPIKEITLQLNFIKSFFLLKYLSKIVEKLIAKQLAQFCEVNEKLYKSQIEVGKNWSTIDTTAILV